MYSSQHLKEVRNLLRELSDRIELFDNESTQKRDSTVEKIAPDIRLVDGNLSINDRLIFLKTRPMTLKLIKAFLSFDNLEANREQLIKFIYGEENSTFTSDLSGRLSLSLSQNLLKLLSRSRLILNESCEGLYTNKKIEWFPFSSEDKNWKLCRFVQL